MSTHGSIAIEEQINNQFVQKNYIIDHSSQEKQTAHSSMKTF